MQEEKDLIETQIYEVGYHILPTVAETEVSDEVGKIQNIITKAGGEIISEGFPEMRGLSYEIAKRIETKYTKYNKAYFGWIKFEAPNEKVEEINGALKAEQDILRFILVKTVRENTMHTPKLISFRKEQKETVEGEEPVEVPKEAASEEEIDKSIDELVIN